MCSIKIRVKNHSASGSMDRITQPACSSSSPQCWKNHVLLVTKPVTSQVCILTNREQTWGMGKTQQDLTLILHVPWAPQPSSLLIFLPLPSPTSEGLKVRVFSSYWTPVRPGSKAQVITSGKSPPFWKFQTLPSIWLTKPPSCLTQLLLTARGKVLTYWTLSFDSAVRSHLSLTA